MYQMGMYEPLPERNGIVRFFEGSEHAGNLTCIEQPGTLAAHNSPNNYSADLFVIVPHLHR
jgi:hypothetical protein